MKIKIISGTYGFRPDGGSRVVPVNMGETCDVPQEEAERLVSIGVAQYIAADGVITNDTAVDDGGAGVNPPDDKKPPVFTTDGVEIPDALEIADGHFVADSLRQMTNQNLAKLATDLGLDVSKCRVKDDYIAVLMTAELDFVMPSSDDGADGDDDDTPPSLDNDDIVK